MTVKDPTAPGTLDRVRRFVNTVSFTTAPPTDKLATAHSAEQWLRENGLLEGSGALDEAGAERLRAFREAVRLALLAHAGDADPAVAWERVHDLAENVRLVMRFGGQPGEASLAPGGHGAEETMGRLVAAIYDAFRTGIWPRLKACRMGDCLWAFYDHSKNGSGAWCSMAGCGNRAKAQRRRARAGTKFEPAEL